MQCAVTDSCSACRDLCTVAVCTALVLCAVATLNVKLVVRGSPDRRRTASPMPAKSSVCEPRRGAKDVLSVSRRDFGLQLCLRWFRDHGRPGFRVQSGDSLVLKKDSFRHCQIEVTKQYLACRPAGKSDRV